SHSLRHMLDDREIVTYEKQGQPKVALNILQQIYDLSLYRNVQPGDGFVTHDQIRLSRKCPRNANSLPLTARELMGKAVGGIPRKPNSLQKDGDPFSQILAAFDSKIPDRLRNDVSNAHPGIET